MAFEATVYRVLIAYPSDVEEEQQAVAETIHRWNSIHARNERVVLLPVTWKTDARPQTGGRPQGFLNEQLGDSDILIGVFWSRLGTPTGKEQSGTVEEIKEFLDQGKPVMLYFAAKPLPPQVDVEQLERLRTFKKRCGDNSLFWTFENIPQLRENILSHLTGTIRDLHTLSMLPKETDNERARRFEAMALQGARSERIRDLAGDSPLTASFLRKDMRRKACLSLVSKGYQTKPDSSVDVRLALENEGEWAARDVTVSVISDEGPVMTNAKVGVIDPGKDRSFLFTIRFPRTPSNGDVPEERSWEFTVHAEFRDGLGPDEASFVFTFRGRFPNFSFEEDPSKASLSSLCRYVRPV